MTPYHLGHMAWYPSQDAPCAMWPHDKRRRWWHPGPTGGRSQ